MRRILMALCLVALVGCADSEVVRLSKGSQVVQCGPYSTVKSGFVDTNLGEFADRKMDECVSSYEAQGYVPIGSANAASTASLSPRCQL